MLRDSQSHIEERQGLGPGSGVLDLDAAPALSIDTTWGLRTKRVFDVVVGSLLLILAAPVMLVISLALLAEGGGVLFAQPRPGLGLRTFRCLKFRTMIPDAEAKLQALLRDDPAAAAEYRSTGKLKSDPRITTLGRVLRRTSLDELPQLINVLRGEMSLVGPRPITLRELPLYGTSLDEATQVRPGLTGPWQVSGRSDTGYAQRIALDLDYVRNRTMRRDLAILARTVAVVLMPFGNGAY